MEIRANKYRRSKKDQRGYQTRSVRALTEATTLTREDSGCIITLGTAGGFTVTLPALEAGLEFTFIAKVAPTTAYIITDPTPANTIHGMVVSKDLDAASDADSTGGTAVDTINFVENKALIGDRVEMVCDGALWYARAYSTAFDGITFA
jgi:hypothetical protein